ncbi:MAG: hypothetical protein J0L62_02615 [Bacteroidetes bacterium]|nr:hypothetical protein [Bacteroidota bacterium]
MIDFRMMINGSIPGGIWAFFITYFVIIGIITYIFYSSDLMTRSRYIKNVVLSTIASFFLYSVLLLLFPAKPIIPNVIIAPVFSENLTPVQEAYPYFLNEILRKSYPGKYHAVDNESVDRYINSHGWTTQDSILEHVRYHNTHFVVFPSIRPDGGWDFDMYDTRYGDIEKYASFSVNADPSFELQLADGANQILQQLYPKLTISQSKLIEGLTASFPQEKSRLANFLKIKKWMSTGQYEKTASFADSLTKLDPVFGVYDFYLGKASFEIAKVTILDQAKRQELLSKANFYLLGAVKKDTLNAEYMNQLADLYLFNSDFENADNAAKAGWFMDPYNYKSYLNIGRLHKSRWLKFEFLNGELFKTQGGLIRRSLDLNPFSSESYFFLGLLLEDERDIEDIKGGRAIEHYEQAVDLNPNYLDAITNLWKLKILGRDFSNFRFYFNKMLSLSPENPDALFYMGMNFYYMNNQDSTIYYFTENLKLRENGNAHMYLAAAYENVSDTANAVKHYVARVKSRVSETDRIAASAYKRIRELDANTWRKLNKEIPPVIEQ